MSTNHPGKGIASACVGAAILLACSISPAFAQTSPDEIRQVLGKLVDIEKAVVFTANRSTFKEICKEEFEFEGHASGISRLEYGSLDPADQDLYKRMLAGRIRSNKSIFDTLDEEGKQDFCFGVRRNLMAYAADFVEAHPSLFKETKPKPKPKEKSYLEQIADELDSQDEAFQLYILRTAENRIGEDMKRIFTYPGNETGSGLTWALKVTATEYRLLSMVTENRFPDISQVYRERSDIYVKIVRGELKYDDMVVEEKQNEKKKNGIYYARLETFKDALKNRPAKDAEPLQAIGKKIGEQLIAQAKYVATEGNKAN